MKIKKILIFGAGAIGRGFIAPIFYKNRYEISFVDKDKNLVLELKKQRSYNIATTHGKKYKFENVKFKNIFYLNDTFDVRNFDIVFTCVGPENCYKNYEKLKLAKLIVSCENDINTVSILIKLTNNKNIIFAIPDVITSNTASTSMLKKDPLLLISEKGSLIVDNKKINFPKPIISVDKKELQKHWDCKLFIHNAPHAIAAYLGYLKGYKFIHESMKDKKIKKIVIGSIKEITQGMIKCGFVNKNFANYYMKKEINRFSNNLLFDPISRVARDPIRKLSKDNRLILALRIALFNKKIPHNTAIGVKAAINYYDKKDSQSVHLKMLLSSLGYEGVLEKVCGLNKKDPLNKLCVKQNLELIL